MPAIAQSILDTQTSFKAIKQKTQLNTQSKVNIFHRDNFYKLPHNWLYMVRDTIKSLESIEVRYKQLLLGKLGEFARIKNRLYSRKFNLQKQIKRNCSPQQKSLIEKHYKQHQLSQQKYKPCDLA